MNDSNYRDVLGERVKADRRRKFKTVDAARLAAEISRGTWEKAERGLTIKDFSLAAIERALEWPEGYAQSILDGADPEKSGFAEALGVSDEPRPRPTLGGLDAYLASIEDRLDSLESRMALMENPMAVAQLEGRRMQKLSTELATERRREAEWKAEQEAKASRNPGRPGSNAPEK